MSTNQQLYGANVAGYAYVFVAPNETFALPTMQINTYDSNGNVNGTQMVDIPTYYQTVDTALGRYVRTIKPLPGSSTHSIGVFNTDENKSEFTNAKTNIIAGGLIFGGSDYTLTGNVAWLIPYSEFEDKFLKVATLITGV